MSRSRAELAETVEELARIRASRALVDRAESNRLREALDVHARSLYGREIWKLDLDELAEIDATLSTLIDFLADQVQIRGSQTH